MKFLNKKTLIVFTAIVLLSFFGKMVFATPPTSFYDPGETLNPNCAPTDTNCDVAAPLTSSSISDTVYGAGWNGVTTIAPSKNAIYDKIETLGTVSSVSVVTANGVSGSVATATTTPAITLTLGAITPTSVNGNIFTTGSSTYTGTAGQTYTFPSTSATLARTDAAQTFTGIQQFSNIKSGTATTADALADNLFATSATTQKGLVVQGKASQTANLLEIQESDGSNIVEVGTSQTYWRNPAGTITATIDNSNGAYTANGGNITTGGYLQGVLRNDTWGAIASGVNSQTDAIAMNSAARIGWSSNAAWYNAANDTGLSRISAGVIGVGTGAAGSVAGTLSTGGLIVGNGNVTITQTATATGALKGIVYTGAVNTNQTLSTEIPSLTLTTAGREWATGALTTQREVLITQPTYSFVGASTITDAATVGIAGAPIKSTNATITNTHGLLIQAGAVSTATNSYGLTVNTQTGATNNYAAAFLGGNVGIGTASPTQALQTGATGNILVGSGTLYFEDTNGYISRTNASNTMSFAPSSGSLAMSLTANTLTLKSATTISGGDGISPVFRSIDRGGNTGLGLPTTVLAGNGSTSATPTNGGQVNIKGGSGAAGVTAGGNVVIDAGAGFGGGVNGYILLGTVNSGNVKIGGTALRGTTEGSNKLDIFDGTAPVGTLANGISLYSTAGELRVMDAAGNATLLSPHENDNNYWVFDSANSETGKNLIIDMELIIKDLNDSLELDYVHETQDGELVTREANGSLLGKLFSKIGTWLADATNGIAKIFTQEIETQNLCVSDESGEKTCITKAQLDALILNAGTSSTSSSTTTTTAPTTTTDTTATDTTTPTDTTTTTTTVDTVPVDTTTTTDPAPEVIPEPEPVVEVIVEPEPTPEPTPEPVPEVTP
jgi:hypothetical protein